MGYQKEKKLVLEYFEALDKANDDNILNVLKEFTSENYDFKGVYPFRELKGKEEVAEKFWKPLKKSLSKMQRRQDVFIAGNNELDGDVWVMSLGHFMGNFDNEWLKIPKTNKMISLRYAEFSCVKDDRITQSGVFVDIIGFMLQAGINPLPPATGNYFVYPGPRQHNGLLFEDAPIEEGVETLALVNKMVAELSKSNDTFGFPPELLATTWSENMIWYGPGGIGASYTIPTYQKQHQLPFRNNLTDKKFNGHICRFAEGSFACFFGWPNLTNTPIGGFLGLPASNKADMQVVDVYSRNGDKLEENWVLIDIIYWLKQQGVDILERTTSIFGN